ncbi:MAG TPA: thermonuclease family protein [Candidatus Limnocylindrales bacterium]|nr:thermonuclease family protein [Candidatus Limnocylindrales bacterium]
MSRFSERKLKGTLSLITAVLGLFIWLGQEQGWFARAAEQAEQNSPGLYHVQRFSDGDTITVDMNGNPETIRMIGVDTPETHDPRKPVQCYGPAASAFTKNAITAAGSQVRLEADSQSTNRDRYDRLLRYVYLPDGTLFNKRLISEGYGFYYPYFPFDKSKEFNEAQEQARAAHRGLWGNCNPTQTDRGGYTSNPQ